jgi:CRISPR-associated endonuclease/helicase Cas3
MNILNSGQSVLVVAPTGLGKTRAALAPFAQCQNQNGLLGTRLIYVLPLRALAQGVKEECDALGISPVIHHGDEPESQFFSEHAVITTIDQYLTAFAGAPLSWASHWSHAAAGAILTSYSVFDEVHLLSPQRGLHLLFGILRLRHRWGLLSCVMTATLPNSAINFLVEHCGLSKIETSDQDIKERDTWRKVELQILGCSAKNGWEWSERDARGLCELIKEKWDGWDALSLGESKKIIVFINTVDRAIALYEALHSENLPDKPKILLAHARFTKSDRERIQNEITDYFGKGAVNEPAILVATQVAEAGLNISAPLVITELCPMDSLIQRAGRCQRFKPKDESQRKGLVIVVKPKGEDKTKWYVPYTETIRVRNGKKLAQFSISEITQQVLEENNGKQLTWDVEKDLINKALNDVYRSFLQGARELSYNEIKENPVGKLYQERLRRRKGEEEPQEEEYAEEDAEATETTEEG